MNRTYVYIRVRRDNGAVGYFPARIKEIHDDGTVTVGFGLYGRDEEITLTEEEIDSIADEVALGLKEY